ncbi:radical SAM protein [Roseisolibacter sp. H3M3-2]|uniref:radical SAM protein n=1 Tax=Roseisolibacter sp. H3M3-2 TaxID=3031323 RepID=UPI0023DC4218|nr:radical SAM protein [Roseisolibacter sp. H3M3-2]MDF1502710.1 radical SAM protein [Roseisolibacter sp. H3M3-2]
MLSSKFKPYHVPLFLGKYAWLKARRRPVLVHFEVTMRCNARCGFCDYWKTPAEAKKDELKSFADAARHFDPMLVTWTGGEPLLRRDLEDLVAAVDRAVRLKYVTLITHGGMLTPERARSLWDAGIHQFNISLDYLDGRHDVARGIPGLTEKIFRTVEAMRAGGIDNVRFNTVLKDDNLDQILPIVRRAEEMGCGVNLSVYTDAKNGNTSHLLGEAQHREIDDLVARLLAFKRRRRGVVTNSDYYLEQIPRYVRGQMTEPCRSGIDTIHVSPTGGVRRCPDFPTDFHWSEYRRYEPIACNDCYYACRGEAQAPIRIASRVRDVMGTTRTPAGVA